VGLDRLLNHLLLQHLPISDFDADPG
jgi:hypothetical protein